MEPTTGEIPSVIAVWLKFCPHRTEELHCPYGICGRGVVAHKYLVRRRRMIANQPADPQPNEVWMVKPRFQNVTHFMIPFIEAP